MLVRLVAILAALCLLAGLVLLMHAKQPLWALWIGGGGALVLLLIGLHRFAVAESRLPKSMRRVLNLHAD
jgi:hypothetical protein